MAGREVEGDRHEVEGDRLPSVGLGLSKAHGLGRLASSKTGKKNKAPHRDGRAMSGQSGAISFVFLHVVWLLLLHVVSLWHLLLH